MARGSAQGTGLAMAAVVILAALALGLVASLGPPPFEATITTIVAAIALPLGAFALGARALMSWGNGSRAMAFVYAVLALMQALLALPAIGALFALAAR